MRRRLREHNEGKVTSTKSRVPFVLIYYEACLNEHDARVREQYLKTAWGKRYIKNRLKTDLKEQRRNIQPREIELANSLSHGVNDGPTWGTGKFGKGVKLDPVRYERSELSNGVDGSNDDVSVADFGY